MVVQHLFAGRYRLTERIAGGGMGEVWRAEDEVLNRPVAVKLLRTAHAADSEFRERLRREARAAASINHAGVVRVHDYGEESDLPGSPVPYLVMELVEGHSLAEELRATGPLGWQRTLLIVGQAAAALQAAHDRGIVHRDIKPANLLLSGEDPSGNVKVADFGIAKVAASVPLTTTGRLAGTAQYVSPEQARGEGTTPGADLYSLGVVAYACLTGSPPFVEGDQLAIALAHVCEVPPDLPDTIPAPVRDLVMSLLNKDPRDRPASAATVARMASQLLAPESAAAPTTAIPTTVSLTTVASTPVRRRSRGRVIAPVLAVGTALAIVSILLAWSGYGRTSVPSMIGRQLAIASAAAAHADLHIAVQTVDFPGSEAGIVTTQSVPAGSTVAVDSTVQLNVASGRVYVPAADILGHSCDHAVALLRDLKLPIVRATKRTQTASTGTVVAVSASGEVAVNTKIVLTVAVAPGDSLPAPGSADPGTQRPPVTTNPPVNPANGSAQGPNGGPTPDPTTAPSSAPTTGPSSAPSPSPTNAPGP